MLRWEVGIVRKLDLQGLRLLLGRDNVYLRLVQDGWSVAQLPFLALSIIQPVGSLEGGTHISVLPESGTKQELFERRLWQNSYEPSRLNCGLKIHRMQKISWSRKKNSVCRFRTYNRLDGLVQKNAASCKMHYLT
jgi:hypothetical protein